MIFIMPFDKVYNLFLKWLTSRPFCCQKWFPWQQMGEEKWINMAWDGIRRQDADCRI